MLPASLLNAPEAIAIICDAMLEAARAGAVLRGGRGRRARRGRAGRGASPASASWSTRSASRSSSATGRGWSSCGDPLGGGRATIGTGPGAIAGPAVGRAVGRAVRPTASSDRARRDAATRARVDPRLVALSVRAGEPAARLRSRGGGRASASTCRPARRSAGRRARRGPSDWSGSAATAADRRRAER